LFSTRQPLARPHYPERLPTRAMDRERRELTEQEQRFSRERRARLREERRQMMQPSIAAADVDAMFQTAVEEVVEHLAERFEQVREQRDALLDEVRMLTTAFENLTGAINRVDSKIIDLPR
jgi:hypothetical protein